VGIPTKDAWRNLLEQRYAKNPVRERVCSVRIQKPGFIVDRILLLGSRQVSSYLVMGDSYALVGGGTAWDVPLLEGQLDRFHVDRHRIRYLVVSHVHHDHCGAVPYLRRKYPWIEVVASEYGAGLLAKEKPVRLMKDLNARTLDRLGLPHSHDDVPLSFENVSVAHRVGDGDELDLGEGFTLQFYKTPGHSRCSMSVYIPQVKALLPGDSIPYPESGRAELTVTANHDYSDYLSSLAKLAPLPIAIVAYEHGGALNGEDAEGIVGRGLKASLRQRDRIRARFLELGDVELLIEEIALKYQSLKLFQLVPFDALRSIVRRMVRSAVEED